MASSFSKAAAHELATKEDSDGAKADIPKQMIGTLHSLCYRALDCPPLAEAFTEDFNERHPQFAVSGSRKVDPDDLGAEQLDAGASPDGLAGDKLLAQYGLLRARNTHPDTWPLTVQGFAQAWESWKESRGAFDYADLIEHAPDVPPGHPRVLFIDEAQDLSRAQFTLLRKWAQYVESLVLVADDDQTIYSFSGADPSNLIDAPIPPENRIVLKQSYRLPKAVHAYASNWIAQVTHRQAKEFLPREATKEHPDPIGSVRASEASLKHPGNELDAIRSVIDQGRSVMILATCGYMLRGWIQALREAGIAYHNPYRPARGDWSPLSRKEGGAASRLSSFLAQEDGRPHWTAWNLAQWVPLLKADGILKRGAKAAIEALAEERPGYRPGVEEIAAWFTAGGPWQAQGAPWPSAEGLAWLAQHCLSTKAGPVAYAASIATQALRRGADARKALQDGPKVIVGTCHSVKGGQADVVYVAPDLSPQAAEQWHRGSVGQDEVRRVLYVGMTRAVEQLVLLRPMGRLSVNLA